MTNEGLFRARPAEERIECSEDELALLIAGLPAARTTVEGLRAVDCGDLPPVLRSGRGVIAER